MNVNSCHTYLTSVRKVDVPVLLDVLLATSTFYAMALTVKFGSWRSRRGVDVQKGTWRWRSTFMQRGPGDFYSNNTVIWKRSFLLYNGNYLFSSQVFTANTDRNTVITNTLNVPLVCRFIRVIPITWQSHISMRLELYGQGPIPGQEYFDSLVCWVPCARKKGMSTRKITLKWNETKAFTCFQWIDKAKKTYQWKFEPHWTSRFWVMNCWNAS